MAPFVAPGVLNFRDAANPAGAQFYVKPFPLGDDNSGDGSYRRPWATLNGARDKIRANNINVTQTGDVVVSALSGKYDSLDLTSQDKGYNGKRVRYESIDGPGGAVIDSSIQVTSWENFAGSVFRARITGTFFTVYENGVRATQARTPKIIVNPLYPMSKAPYFLTAAHAASLTALQYNPVDFDPSSWTLADIYATIWPTIGGNIAWLTDTGPISTKVAPVLTLTNQGKFVLYNGTGARYFVHGVLDLLTQAGEWYHDRTNNYLYYWARDGAINAQDIRVPAAMESITLTGTNTSDRCANVTIDGFQVQNTDFARNSNGWYRSGYPYDGVNILGPGGHVDNNFAYFASNPEAAYGAIHLKNVDNVVVTRCKTKCVGMHGMYLDGYGQNLTVSNMMFERNGLSGVRADNSWPGEGNILTGNRFTNFKVIRCGELSGGASAFELSNCGNNEVDHFYMQYGPRKAVWIFGDSGIATTLIYAFGNNVHHGKAENFCDDSGDTGAFTVSSLSSRVGGPYVQNTFLQLIANNVNAHPSMLDTAPGGFFNDDETYRHILNFCQATNCQGAQFRFNPVSSGEPILTGCSFLADGSADPSFNPALMDTANIGVLSSYVW